MSRNEDPYEYTLIEYSHPNPRYRSHRHVSVDIVVCGEPLVAGASIEVAR